MIRIMFCVDNIIKTINVGYKAIINQQQDKIKNSAVLYSNVFEKKQFNRQKKKVGKFYEI